MPLRNEIKERQIAAMKSGDARQLAVMRFLWSAIKNSEIDLKKELSDEEVLAVISRQVKQLQDALKDFETGGRQDLVTQTTEEIDILKSYLPEQLSDEQLEVVVDSVIAKVGAKTPQDVGKVMGAVMKEAKGKADGNRVREMVSKKLNA